MTEPTLTTSEKEIVDALAKGWSCETIAGWLGIKKKTVYAHILNIANKLGENPDHTKPFHRVVMWAARRRENAA